MAEIDWNQYGKTAEEETDWSEYGKTEQDDTEVRNWLKSFYKGQQNVDDIAITPQIRQRYEAQTSGRGRAEIPKLNLLEQAVSTPVTLAGGLMRGVGHEVGLWGKLLNVAAQSPMLPVPPYMARPEFKEGAQRLGEKIYETGTNIGKDVGPENQDVHDVVTGIGEAIPGLAKYAVTAPALGMANFATWGGIEGYLDALDRGEDGAVKFAEGAGKGLVMDFILKGAHKFLPKSLLGRMGATGLGFLGGETAIKSLEEGKLTLPTPLEAAKTFTIGAGVAGLTSGRGRRVAEKKGPTTVSPTPKIPEPKAPEVKAKAVEPPTEPTRDIAHGGVNEGKVGIEVLNRTRETEIDFDAGGKPIRKSSGSEGDLRAGEGIGPTGNKRIYKLDLKDNKVYDVTRGSRTEVTDPKILSAFKEAGGYTKYAEQPEMEISGKDLPTTEELANLGINRKEIPASKGVGAEPSITEPLPPTKPSEPQMKVSRVVTNTFAKEFGKENALELAKDFAEYPPSVRAEQKQRAAGELLRDGLKKSSEDLINKSEPWDDYDLMKANEIRRAFAKNAKTPEDFRNPLLRGIAKRTRERGTEHGKGLQTFAEVDPVQDPVRVATRNTEDAIRERPQLREKRKIATHKTKLIKEKLNDINKEAVKKNIKGIVNKIKRVVPSVVHPKEKIIEDGYKQTVFDFLKRELSTRFKITKTPPTPEEMLERRISGRIDPKQHGGSEHDALIKDMVNTVFNSVNELLPDIPKQNQQAKDIALLRNRIVNSAEFSATLANTQKLLKTKYAQNPDALLVLDKLLNTNLLRPVSSKIIDALINKELRFSGIKISDIIKKHYTEIDKTGKSLAKKISEGLELNDIDSANIAKYVEESFGNLTRNAKTKALENMLGKSKPKKGEKDITQKIIEMSNLGAMDDAQFADIVAKKMGVPIITPEHMFALSKQAQKIQETKDFNQRIDEIGKLHSMLYADIPKTRMQKVWDARILAMLSNAKTILRNIFGQGGDAVATSLAKDVIGVPVDRIVTNLLSKKIGQPVNRTMARTDWGMMVRKGIAAGKMGVADVQKRIDTTKHRIEALTGTKLGKSADKFGIGRPEWKEGGIMEKVQKGVAYGLQVPDRMFQEAVYWESLHNQVRALGKNAKSKLTPELKQKISDQAWSEASQITYRKMNKFSEMVVALQKKMGPVGKLLLTFPKVAANLIYTGAYKYSPVGLGVGLNKARKFIKQGGIIEGTNQRQIVFDITRGSVGTSISMLGMLLGYLGTATPGRDPDANIQLSKEAKGEQPGGLKLFGHIIRVDWIQPLSIPLELGIQIGAMLKNKDNGADILEKAVDVIIGAGNAIVDQPLFTGVQRTIAAGGKSPMDKIMNGAKALATSAAASWVPTLSGQARQLIDPYQRQLNRKYGEGGINSLKSFGFATAALIANKIPFASKLLEKRKNIFGEDIKYHETGNLLFDFLDRFINPAIITDLKKEPGIDYVLKLNSDKPFGMTQKPLPRQTEKTQFFTRDGNKYFLSPKQKSKYQALVGKAVYDFINEYYNSNMSADLTVEEQVKEIYSEISRIGREKRMEMLEEMDID